MGAPTRVIRDTMRLLRARREELSLSQAQVAEIVGVNASYIGLVERGERVPSLEVLLQLADAVGLPHAELFAPADNKATGEVPEVRAIGVVISKWPSEHRGAAVRVVTEMDKLLRSR